MKTNLKPLAIVSCLFGAILRLNAAGYIVPNGVVMDFGGLFFPQEIDVLHNPANPASAGSYTGFLLNPVNANTFAFWPIADVGVRVFLVSPNDPISLQPILSMNYTELSFPNNYVFADGVPFYAGLYTGNQPFAPPDGIYSDPLFGWVELVNNNGVIQILDSALEYQGGGIYAGTQTIIPAPEPGTLALAILGAASLFVFRHGRRIIPAR